MVDDIAITRRQLDRLLVKGLIDEETYQRVMDALDEASRPVVPVVQAAPVTPPPLPPEYLKASVFADVMPTSVPPEPLLAPAPLPTERPRAVIPIEPKPPRKPFSEVLATFMQESNIRWGELIGGLLAVGCSAALILTFWSEIAARPVLKFFLFNAIAAAVFAVGLYTEHRWKLPTTSRGLLLISALLVPLDFLAIVAQSPGGPSLSAIAAEGSAFALFAWLLHLAGRTLIPAAPWALVVGVLGGSVSQCLINRLAPAGVAFAGLGPIAVALVPLAFYCAATLGAAMRLRTRESIDAAEANSMLTLLGTSTFAVLVAIGLLIYRGSDWASAVRHLAPAISLAALPALGVGLMFWQRLVDRALAAWRTAWTAIAIVGALVLVGSLALAWPNPGGMLAIALVDLVVLTLVAFAFNIPATHALAIPAGVLAYLLGFHLLLPYDAIQWWAEDPAKLARALASASSGSALVPLAVALLAAGQLLRRRDREGHDFAYLALGGLVGLLSLALSGYHGLGRTLDHGATWVFACYALLALAAALRNGCSASAWAGSILLGTAIVQGLVFRYPLPGGSSDRWTLALLIYATVTTLASLAPRLIEAMMPAATPEEGRDERFALWPDLTAFIYPALAASVVILVLTGFTLVDAPRCQYMALAGRVFWVGGIWLLLSAASLWPVLFTAFQIATAAGIALASVAMTAHGLLDPRTLQAQGIALALYCLVWVGLRRVLQRIGTPASAHALLDPPWISFDRLLPYGLLALLAAMSLYAAIPGIQRELATTNLPSLSATHFLACGPGAWTLLGLLLIVFIAHLWERLETSAVLAILIAAAAGALLLAAPFDCTRSTASATRWLATGLLVCGSLPFWIRGIIKRGAEDRAVSPPLALLLGLTISSILWMTIYRAHLALEDSSAVDPIAGSLFYRIGSSANYLPPLVLTMLVLIGHAIHRRSQAFALSGALILHLTVTLAHALWLVSHGVPFDASQIVRSLQFNAIAGGIFALGWLVTFRQFAGHNNVPLLLTLHIAGVFALVALPLAHIEVRLCIDPTANSALAAIVAQPAGWLAIVAASLPALLLAHTLGRKLSATALALGLLFAGSLAAFCFAANGWLAYHVLLATRAAGAMLMLAIGAAITWRSDDEAKKTGITRWVAAFGAIVLLLALRAINDDPSRPWWTIAGLLAASLISISLSIWTLHGGWLYPAGILLNLATSLWYFDRGYLLAPGAELSGLLHVNAIVFGVSAVAFIVLEMGYLRPTRQQVVYVGPWPFHRLATILATITVALLAVCAMGADVLSPFLAGLLCPSTTIWLSLACAAGAMLACLWDVDVKWSVAGLYLLGLAVVANGLHAFHLRLDPLLWCGGVALAGYSLLVGFAFTQRVNLARLAEQIGIPPRQRWPALAPGWLGIAIVIQSVLVVLLALHPVSHGPLWTIRFVAAMSVIGAAVALGLLELDRPGTQYKRAALLVGAMGTVLWGWAWLDPMRSSILLDRLVVTMVVLAGVTAIYAAGLVKLLRRQDDWTTAARQLVPLIGGATAMALFGVLAMEGVLYDDAGGILAWWGIGAVTAALLTLMVAGIICAVVPGRDPLGLSERGRTAYVYAAEVLLVLLMLHIRLTVPSLFRMGIFRMYWPFIMMGIAFFGIGLSEFFRRQGRRVLAEPLERTGAFLPVLPALGFWVIHAQAFEGQFSYAGLLFATGLLYGFLSVTRKSMIFGILSALAANGGLWAVLHRVQGMGFFEHPQLWLIPAALSVLAAAHLNRDRLSDQQMKTIRYIAMMIVYVSSSADIYVNGLEKAPWLPLVLAGLAVLGVLLGIAWRIQSFLFLGTLFLLVSVGTMIRYAQLRVHGNWPWLVAGAVLGAAIVVVFALFEKKRAEMVKLVEQLKEWEG